MNLSEIKEKLKKILGIEPTAEQLAAAEAEFKDEVQAGTAKIEIDSEKDLSYEEQKQLNQELLKNQKELIQRLNEREAAEKKYQDEQTAKAKIEFQQKVMDTLKKAVDGKIIPTDEKSEEYQSWERLLKADFEAASQRLMKAIPIITPPAQGDTTERKANQPASNPVQELKNSIAAELNSKYSE